MFYTLCREHPKLQTVTVVLDNSNFSTDKDPQVYTLTVPKPLVAGSRGGGQFGKKEVRDAVEGAFLDFFGELKGPVNDKGKWRKWREGPKGRNWKEVKFVMKSIAKK